MNRRTFLQLATLSGTATLTAAPTLASAEPAASPSQPFWLKPFKHQEATVHDLQTAMQAGKETAVSLAQQYLRRIDELSDRGPTLRAVLEVNPDALTIAHALDQERKNKGPLGPLHGIPVLIKDNIGTHDRMMTTAGSLALLGSIPPRDAFVVRQLRAAGAVILGKTNLSEWANFRGERSSSGWSGRGGQTNNPYALDRNPSGSSAGSAVAVSANLCAVAVGTETDGSIVSPAAVCGIVGLKPTVGLVSRSGIIPISRTQDTAGPMARTVTDSALLLAAMTGVDPEDEATAASAGHVPPDYTRFLSADGLSGARLGVARDYFHADELTTAPLLASLETMRSRGAILVDFTDNLQRYGDAEWNMMQFEFKAGINAYLAALGSNAPVHTLHDIIEFNNRNRSREMPFFGQEELVRADAKGPLTDPAYLAARDRCRRLSREEGIDAVMDKHQLDAIIAPSGGPAGKTDAVYGDRGVGGSSTPAAVAGYPNITVPAGQVFGLPFGISFFGRAWSEPVLLKLAFAFEQATNARLVPQFLPSIG